jgi:hypothetical protein
MLTILYDCAAVVGLICIVVQDYKDRAVTLVLFPLVALFLTLKSLTASSLSEIVESTLVNTFFIATNICLLWAYFIIKKKSLINIFKEKLGWGDLAFWITIICYFRPVTYTVFFIVSLLFALLLHWSFRSFYKAEHKNLIPLAGWQSLCLIAYILLQYPYPTLSHIDFYLLSYFINY